VLFKIIIIAFLIAMVVSLFSGLYFLAKDGNNSKRTLHALTARISIWVVLFALLGIGVYTGILTPSNSLTPEWAKQPQQTGAQNN
jgi:hypothetical protein